MHAAHHQTIDLINGDQRSDGHERHGQPDEPNRGSGIIEKAGKQNENNSNVVVFI
jgi:hypothetical protein